MGDELEKFIVRNRSEFDSEEPGEVVWQEIQNRIKPKRTFQIWWRIAAILFLISTLVLLFEKNIQNIDEGHPKEELTEFVQVEDYYTKLISEKKAEIAQFDKSQLKREFLLEVDRLDQMYNELKNTYKNQNSTDLLMDAMISNLRLRIDILNQQIKILKKLKETENESDTSFEI